jgi:hypothetical protein
MTVLCPDSSKQNNGDLIYAKSIIEKTSLRNRVEGSLFEKGSSEEISVGNAWNKSGIKIKGNQ